MVLTHKVGKERNFALALLLFVVTFGIYGIYRNYKAHQEVFRQFELERDGRDEGFLWLIFGYVLFQPLIWIYHWLFVGNVRYVRERLGFAKNLSVGTFLGLSITGSVVTTISFYAGVLLLDLSLVAADEGRSTAGLVLGTAVAGILALLGAALWVTAYGLLQRDLNGLWRGYDTRMVELTGRPPVPSVGGRPVAPNAPAPPAWEPARPQ